MTFPEYSLMSIFDLNPDYAITRLRGSTRVDFLHRLSSGEVRDKAAAKTTFLTPIGRMIDAVTVIPRTDEHWLLGHAVHQDKLLRWLRKFIFFNDDVQVTLVPELGVWAIADLPPQAVLGEANRPDVSLPWPELGLTRMIGPRASQPAATADASAFHALRIAGGVAGAPGEINEDHIPLEAGLWDHISFSKGCYTGQEIIVRMESRNQLARQLCLLDIAGAQPGQPVIKDGAEIGRISSASTTHALAYLRSAAAEAGAGVDGGMVVRVVKNAAA